MNAIISPGNPKLPCGHPDPVFVLAPARSCSTVTIALLSGHPDIHAFPELLLFQEPTVGCLLNGLTTPQLQYARGWAQWSLAGLLHTVAELYGEGQRSDDSIRWARTWLEARRDLPATDLLHYLLHQVSPLTGVEKSPGTTNSDEALARCLAAFPRARLIHLVRHPVATQASMREHWQRFFTGRPAVELSVTCATTWYQAHQRIVTALDQLPPAQRIRVRAEDLLNEPQTWLCRILRFLGLRADDDIVTAMLRTEQWHYATASGSNAPYGGDPKFMRSPRLRPVRDPGPVSFPSAWQLPAEMERRMAQLAERFGYRSAYSDVVDQCIVLTDGRRVGGQHLDVRDIATLSVNYGPVSPAEAVRDASADLGHWERHQPP